MPGSLIILRGPSWWLQEPDGTLVVDEAQALGLIDQIERIAGHNRFVVAHVLEDDIQLHGPEELLDLMRTIGRAAIAADEAAAQT